MGIINGQNETAKTLNTQGDGRLPA
jgi:hypothetical protein